MRHVVYDITGVGTWACWALVGLVWAVGARAGKRGSAVRRREGRDLASLAGVAAGVIVVATPHTVWRELTLGSPWLRVAGLMMLVPATAGTISARVALGRMWSSAVIAREDHALRTSGPYGVTRHPIYTAILGMVAGTAMTQGLGRWAVLFAAVTLVLLLKIRAEERLLTREFPEQYPQYQRRVPQLIPRPRRSRLGAQAQPGRRGIGA